LTTTGVQVLLKTVQYLLLPLYGPWPTTLERDLKVLRVGQVDVKKVEPQSEHGELHANLHATPTLVSMHRTAKVWEFII
jgi:hypothetical protein